MPHPASIFIFLRIVTDWVRVPTSATSGSLTIIFITSFGLPLFFVCFM